MMLYLYSLFLILGILLIFFIFSKYIEWESLSKSIFECGFSSYFFSRFSFSIQYFLTALTFLLLDLELCFLLPYFNDEVSNFKVELFFFIFTLILTIALLIEWLNGMLDWKK